MKKPLLTEASRRLEAILEDLPTCLWHPWRQGPGAQSIATLPDEDLPQKTEEEKRDDEEPLWQKLLRLAVREANPPDEKVDPPATMETAADEVAAPTPTPEDWWNRLVAGLDVLQAFQLVEATDDAVTIQAPSSFVFEALLAHLPGISERIAETLSKLGLSPKTIRVLPPSGEPDGAVVIEVQALAGRAEATPSVPQSPTIGVSSAEGITLARSAWWKRVLEELSTTLRPRIFHAWFRPTVGLAETDDSIAVLVPSRLFILVILRHYLPAIAEAARRAGLPPKRLNFVSAFDNTQPSTAYFVPADGQDPATTQKLLEAIRQALGAAEVRVVSPEELEGERVEKTSKPPSPFELIDQFCLNDQLVHRLTPEQVKAASDAIIQAARTHRVPADDLLRYLIAKFGLQTHEIDRLVDKARAAVRHEVCSFEAVLTCILGQYPARKRHENSYAVLHSAIPDVPGVSAGPAPRAGLQTACICVDFLRCSALLLSPERQVHAFETRRRAERGMSPRLAAGFLWLLSRAVQEHLQQVEPGILALRMPDQEFFGFLRMPMKRREFERIRASLTFHLSVETLSFRNSQGEFDPVQPIRDIAWSPQEVIVLLDAGVVGTLRRLCSRPELGGVRFVQPGALEVLRDLPTREAALVLFLADVCHGDKYTNHPLPISLDELHLRLLGTPAPRDPRNRRRFWQGIGQDLRDINQRDLLFLFGVKDPRRWIGGERDRDGKIVKLRRVYRPAVSPSGPDELLDAWLAERTERAPDAETPSARLYADYSAWAKARGYRPEPHRAWGRRMGKRFQPVWRKIGGQATRMWRGLRLRT